MALSEREISLGVDSLPKQDASFPRPRVLISEASTEVDRDVDYTIGFLRRDENPPKEAGTVRSIPVYEGKSFTFREPNDGTETPLYVEHYRSLSEPLSSARPNLDQVIKNINVEPTDQPRSGLLKTLVTVLVSALPKS